MPAYSLRPLDRLPAGAAGASGIVGLAGVAAWLLGADGPALLAPMLRMQFNTAVALVTAGVGLLALTRRWRIVALVCGSWLLALGSLTLAQYVRGIDLGIDQVLFVSRLGTDNPHPGRMGASAAACFTLLGIATVALAQRRPSRAATAMSAACAGTLVICGLWVLCIWATSFTVHVELFRFAQMATPTAASLVMLGTGLACVAIRRRMDWFGTKLDVHVPILAWGVLAGALLLSMGGWYMTALNVMSVGQNHFTAIADRMTAAIVARMADHEQVLNGLRGLMLGSDQVTRAEWLAYVEQQQLSERFRGMLGVGLAPRISTVKRAEHTEASRGEGLPQYRIRPEPQRGFAYPVQYMEPMTAANAPVLGFDLYSDPVRREAMERACRTGKLAISRRLALLQDSQGAQPSGAGAAPERGFLMFMPVLEGRPRQALGADPCSDVRAFVYSPFRTAEVLGEAVEQDLRSVDLRVLDGAEDDPPSVLYDSASTAASDRADIARLFEATRSEPIGGHRWTLVFSTRPAFAENIPYHQPVAVMLGGTLLSVLLFGLTWSLATTRARALALADDMTQRLRESEAQYRRLVDDSRGLICMHDLDGVLTYVNPAAAEALGRPAQSLVGTLLRDLIAPEVQQFFPDYLARIRAERKHHGTMIVVTASGERRYWAYDNSLREVPGQPAYVLGHGQDVTDLHKAQRALEEAHNAMREIATRDALTGLCNRWLLYEHLGQAIELARREKTVLAVLFVDLDHFKKVNDTLGHRAGDELLQHVAKALRHCARKSDVAARLGGDEFVLLLNRLSEAQDAARVAMTLSEELRRPLYVGGTAVTVTGSIGIASYPADGEDPETLVQAADEAMYRAKHGGRDGFRFSSEQAQD